MERLDPHALDRAVQSICQARHIFVAGMGRSGYMMRAFAMRLMQMGLLVYMVGDTKHPPALRRVTCWFWGSGFRRNRKPEKLRRQGP